MSEYIKKVDALEIVKRTSGDYAAAFVEIKRLPKADVAPVVHGKWITDTQEVDSCIKCSVCGIELDKYIIGGDMPEYCLCGAKMDLE